MEIAKELEKPFQEFLKNRVEREKLEQLRKRGDQLLSYFYEFVNPVNSCAGYTRPHMGRCVIKNWRNQPICWEIDVSPIILSAKDDISFYRSLPVYLLEGNLRLNAWFLAQAWGWMHVTKAIESVFEYNYLVWREDWGLFWKKLSKQIDAWGLFTE